MNVKASAYDAYLTQELGKLLCVETFGIQKLNSELRQQIVKMRHERGIQVFIPCSNCKTNGHYLGVIKPLNDNQWYIISTMCSVDELQNAVSKANSILVFDSYLMLHAIYAMQEIFDYYASKPESASTLDLSRYFNADAFNHDKESMVKYADTLDKLHYYGEPIESNTIKDKH